MSHSELIEFRDGLPAERHEFRNGWGAAPRVWSVLYDKYLKDPNKEYDCWLTACSPGNSGREFWDLAKRTDLPMFERAVHAATFDRAIVRREHFVKFADHIREFDLTYPEPERVNHWPAWEKIIVASDAEAVGFYQTSVAEYPWQICDREETEDQESVWRPYDLNRDALHFEVYDWLEAEPWLQEAAAKP